MLKAVATESLAASGITIGTSVITSGTDTRVLFDDGGTVGESAGLTFTKGNGGTTSVFVAAGIGQVGVSLAIGGATIGTNALAVTGTSALGNTTIGAGVTQAAWTTSGIRAIHNAGTYVDSSSSGTVATAYTDLFGASTINASSATTYTQYYGAYFVAPIATGNVTMTNKSALGADTISIGGQAQGTNALAVTGTGLFSGNCVVGAGSNFNWVGRTTLFSGANGNLRVANAAATTHVDMSVPTNETWQFGLADAAAPVAQTLRVQSVVAGTADTAGADWTIDASVSTGAGVPGNIVFKAAGKGAASTVQNTLNSVLTIRGGTTNNTNVGYPSVIIGAGAAIATTATDGFLYIPTCAGTPAGTPTAATGAVPMVFDTTNSQFWFYTSGAWKQPKTPAGAATVTWQ